MSVHFIRSDLHLAVNFIKIPYGKFIQRQNLVFKAVLLAEPAGKGTNFSLLLFIPSLLQPARFCCLLCTSWGANWISSWANSNYWDKKISSGKKNRPNELKKHPNRARDLKQRRKEDRGNKERKRRKILKSVLSAKLEQLQYMSAITVQIKRHLTAILSIYILKGF